MVGKKKGLIKRVIGKVIGGVKKVGRSIAGVIEHAQNAKGTDTMSDETKLHAHLAQQSYNKVGEREDSLGGYVRDSSLDTQKSAVYHNKKTNKTIISYRGTDPTNLEDLHNDAHILRGTQATTDRYKRSEKLYDDVKKKYNSDITSVGHSLGGNISEHIARKKGGKASSFNTGRGADKAYAVASAKCLGSNKPSYCGSVNRHHIVGDALSALNKGYGTGSSYKTAGLLGSHSLDNFTGKSNPIGKFKPQKRVVGSLG